MDAKGATVVESCEVTFVHRATQRRLANAASLFQFIAIAGAIVASMIADLSIAWLLLASALSGPVTLGAIALGRAVRRSRKDVRSVRASARGIPLLGRDSRHFSAASIHSAHFTDTTRTELNVVLANGDMFEIGCKSASIASRMLEAIERGPGAHTATFELERDQDLAGASIASALFFLAWFGALDWLAVPLAPWFALALALGSRFLALRRFGGAAVTVGAEGLLVQRGKRAAYHGFRDIIGVVARWGELEIHRADGGIVRVSLEARVAARATLRILDSAGRAFADLKAESATADELDVRSMPATTIRNRLARISNCSPTYRMHSHCAAELVRIVANPRERTGRRIGAAWALGLGHDEQAQDEARTAARTIAHPRTRMLVERALTDEVDEREIVRLDDGVDPALVANPGD